MKKFYLVLLGLLSVWLGAAAETDTRTEVTEVVATSNIDDIIGYGKERNRPAFTMSEGSIASINPVMTYWQKKNDAGEWAYYYEPTFTEGTYRVEVRVVVGDEYGTTHKLADDYTLAIDGKAFMTKKPFISADSSYGDALSPEIIVNKEEIITYAINVTNGKAFVEAEGLDVEVTEVETGKQVKIVADEPADGKEFNKWIVESGDITLSDENSATTTFTMPASEVTIKAIYGDVAELINELTLIGLTKPVVGELPNDEVSLGDNVDIVFKGWSVRSESDGDFDGMREDGRYDTPFEEGKEYLFMLQALPKDGYCFAPDLKVIYDSKEIPDLTEGTNLYTGKGILEDGMLIVAILQDSMMSSSEDIRFTESEVPADVYNLQGILVKLNATVEDIRSLPSGIYITHGKKVIVK